MLRAAMSIVVVLVTFSMVSRADVLRVGGVSSPFTTIQEAIDAARDGDVILVSPLRVYSAFRVDGKSITIRAMQRRFLVIDEMPVTIENVAEGQSCHLSGMTYRHGRRIAFRPALEIRNSAGEVGIHKVIVLETFGYDGDQPERVSIESCQNVHVSSSHIIGQFAQHSARAIAPVFRITASRVQLSDVAIKGTRGGSQTYSGGRGLKGGPALGVEAGSRVVLGRSRASGGAGYQNRPRGYFCSGFSPSSGDGGPAVEVMDSELLIIGTNDDVIRGGDGSLPGAMSYCCDSCQYCWTFCGQDGPPGRGGPGVLAGPGAIVRVSGATLIGGIGIVSSEHDGVPFEGEVAFIEPAFPTLAMSRRSWSGSEMQFLVTGTPGWSTTLMLSNRRGWIDAEGISGAPVSALPGDQFFSRALGLMPSSGELSEQLTVPDRDELLGVAITAQAGLIGSGGEVFLSNASTSVLSRTFEVDPDQDVFTSPLVRRDCNGNGVDDVRDVLEGTSGDCNANLIPDECDIASERSQDCDLNGVPDECGQSTIFRDTFARLDGEFWWTEGLVGLTSVGKEIPSPPNAFFFQRTQTQQSLTLMSGPIDTRGQYDLALQFEFEKYEGYSGTGPTSDFGVEYLTDEGLWSRILTLEGDGTTMSAFALQRVPIPADGVHERTTFRFTLDPGGLGGSRWLIDNVHLLALTDCDDDGIPNACDSDGPECGSSR